MKTKTILLLTLLIILFACNDSAVKREVKTEPKVVEIDIYSDINERLKKAEDIDTPVELIKYYYGEVDNEEDVEIKVDDLGKGQYTINLIHDHIKDDSISGMRILMTAQQNNKKWTVQDIQRTWKCYKGRGHTEFSSEPCF